MIKHSHTELEVIMMLQWSVQLATGLLHYSTPPMPPQTAMAVLYYTDVSQ